MHEPNDITSLSPINGGSRLVEEMPLRALPLWGARWNPSSQVSRFVNCLRLPGV